MEIPKLLSVKARGGCSSLDSPRFLALFPLLSLISLLLSAVSHSSLLTLLLLLFAVCCAQSTLLSALLSQLWALLRSGSRSPALCWLRGHGSRVTGYEVMGTSPLPSPSHRPPVVRYWYPWKGPRVSNPRFSHDPRPQLPAVSAGPSISCGGTPRPPLAPLLRGADLSVSLSEVWGALLSNKAGSTVNGFLGILVMDVHASSHSLGPYHHPLVLYWRTNPYVDNYTHVAFSDII